NKTGSIYPPMLGQPRNCSIGFKRPLHHAISTRHEGSAGLGRQGLPGVATGHNVLAWRWVMQRSF
ncbi:MAG: hypothetical protein MUQ81_04695, partial [Planktomarina temperata]|nr:hypothetical protein [Planktomarina temperata]